MTHTHSERPESRCWNLVLPLMVGSKVLKSHAKNTMKAGASESNIAIYMGVRMSQTGL